LRLAEMRLARLESISRKIGRYLRCIGSSEKWVDRNYP
jgi:hypothetical protein